MRGCTRVMPSVFFIKIRNCNNSEFYMDGSYIFCNYEAVFPQSLRHFQHTVANTEYDAVYQCCKIPNHDFGAHNEHFVSVHFHLQNGVHVVYILYRARQMVVRG
jgi:hypothetical protein